MTQKKKILKAVKLPVCQQLVADYGLDKVKATLGELLKENVFSSPLAATAKSGRDTSTMRETRSMAQLKTPGEPDKIDSEHPRNTPQADAPERSLKLTCKYCGQ